MEVAKNILLILGETELSRVPKQKFSNSDIILGKVYQTFIAQNLFLNRRETPSKIFEA